MPRAAIGATATRSVVALAPTREVYILQPILLRVSPMSAAGAKDVEREFAAWDAKVIVLLPTAIPRAAKCTWARCLIAMAPTTQTNVKKAAPASGSMSVGKPTGGTLLPPPLPPAGGKPGVQFLPSCTAQLPHCDCTADGPGGHSHKCHGRHLRGGSIAPCRNKCNRHQECRCIGPNTRGFHSSANSDPCKPKIRSGRP